MRALPLLLPIVLLASCAETGGTRVPDVGTGPSGSISGRIVYPSEVTPAMRICAVRGVGIAPICVASPAGQVTYRLDRLPPGEYQIVAALSEGDMRVGGHTQQVQCIRAPCPEALQSVSVTAGVHRAGADLNGFYAARPDFPPIP